MKLEKYIEIMETNDYDDEEVWHEIPDEELKNLGFNAGALRKWRKIYKKEFTKTLENHPPSDASQFDAKQLMTQSQDRISKP
eukprot:UN03947